jgi:hypothetical protein
MHVGSPPQREIALRLGHVPVAQGRKARTPMTSSALIFNQHSFASTYLHNVQMRRGVGHAVLLANLRTHNNLSGMPAPLGPEIPLVIHFSGEIRNSAGDHVAEISPAHLRWYGNRPEDSVYLQAAVAFAALSVLNEDRKPGADNVQLTFALNVDMQGAKDWQRLTVELMHRIPASDWLALLEQARHTQASTIEVALEGPSIPAGLAISMGRYRAAIRHMQLCQWDDAIAECRQVIEDTSKAIGASESIPGWAQYGDSTKREAWTFPERCGAIRGIIRHATHLAHHGQSEFTALEARYVIELTGVLLKFYSGRLQQ